MTYVTHQPGSMTQGPRIEVGVATGWEWEPIDSDADGLDELDDLIEDLQQARAWLLAQDPNERLHGPPSPMDPQALAILRAMYGDLASRANVHKIAATLPISAELLEEAQQ